MANLRRRIEWCDIFKGLLIILVVVIHATYYFNGQLNQYAYQFGMQALFFISGYTGKTRNQREHSLFEEIFKKFYKLVIPYYIINLIGISLFWLFNKLQILAYISEITYPDSYLNALKALFSRNNIVYCDWFGATWFLIALFWANIIFKALALLFKKDIPLLIASLAVFFVSKALSQSGLHPYFLDLGGISQVFITFGYLSQKKEIKERNVPQLLVMLFLTGAAWWISVHLGLQYIVMYPERKFNGIIDLFLPVYGILMTVCLAKLLTRTSLPKKVLIYLGQNSIGIMCFHLVGFKVSYLLLILLGQMDIADAYHLIPWPELAPWWPLISVLSILFSILLWKGLNKISLIRILLGGGNVKKAYGQLMSTRLVLSLKKVGRAFLSLLSAGAARYKISTAICISVLLLGGAGRIFYLHSGRIQLDFPYRNAAASLKGGWLPQSDGEDYRWFNRQAEIEIFLLTQENVEIKGYIPDNIQNTSYFSVILNGEEIYQEQISAGQLIEIYLPSPEALKPCRVNTLEIKTDGFRIPAPEDADQRVFSAYISSISFY